MANEYKPDPLSTAKTDEELYAFALWHVYHALGFDTDGDTNPKSVIAGMGAEQFALLVIDSAHETYEQYENTSYDAAGEDA